MENQKLDAKSKLKKFFKVLLVDSWEIFRTVIISLAIVLILTQVFIVNAIVPSSSMESTLPVGSYLFCLRTDYWTQDPQRGDIILFRRDNGESTVYTKRVVGIPGDTVEIKHGITYVNGEKYEEPWLKETPDDESYGPFEVPAGDYFCMGDNRNNSYDCRFWEETYVPRENIFARVRLMIDAPNTIRWFKKSGENSPSFRWGLLTY